LIKPLDGAIRMPFAATQMGIFEPELDHLSSLLKRLIPLLDYDSTLYGTLTKSQIFR